MHLKNARTICGLGGAVALTVAMLGGTLPALASTADTPHHAGGLAVDPDLTVAPHYSAPQTSAHIFRAASIPASVDLTAFAPPAGDQGPVGSCASWATGYTTMGWWARKAGDSSKLFAPMYLYSQVHVANTADGGGSYPSDNYSVLQDQGIDTQGDWTGDSTTFSRTPNAAEQAAAAQFETGSFHQLFYSGQAQNGVGAEAQTAIEQALANGYPVGIGIPIYDAFYSLNPNDSTYLLSDANSTTNYEGGHYVVALGYNATGVIIENSWGTLLGRSRPRHHRLGLHRRQGRRGRVPGGSARVHDGAASAGCDLRLHLADAGLDLGRSRLDRSRGHRLDPDQQLHADDQRRRHVVDDHARGWRDDGACRQPQP